MSSSVHVSTLTIFDIKGTFYGTRVLKPQSLQLINLKLLSKFHVTRANRSRVISKSLKLLRLLVGKWLSKKNEGTRNASVGCSNNSLYTL